jgi:diguanylate cyclase (GGDEF)-like protein
LNTQLSEIMALESKVREQAIRDALTGLYNRHYLSEMLEAELSRARRGTYTVAFLLIDLDRFKEVNDTFGHPAGDQALKSVAKIISELTRRSDIACRFGGEEFMVILPEIAKADAQLRAEQLRQKIEALKLPAGEKTIQLTASIGVAMYPLHGETSDEMLSVVDTALYRAKETGRNRVILCGG